MKKRRLHLVDEEEENKSHQDEEVQISYPATPMLSIADALEFFNTSDLFKSSNYSETAAERKEVPPLAYITDDYYILPKSYADEYLLS